MPRDIQVRELEVAALIPSARNARTHSPEQVAEIEESIKAFGFNDPVAVNTRGELIEGHGRVLAARKMGLPTVPGFVLDLTPAQERAYMLAHNKIALKAGWDTAMLLEELRAIEVDGLDITITGFSEVEVKALEAPPGSPGAAAAAPGGTAQFNYQEKFGVLVECTGEAHQQQVYEDLKRQGHTVKVLTV